MDSLACSPAGPLRASLDNRLPRTDSLACSPTGSLRNSGQLAAHDRLTRLQLRWTTLCISAVRLPRHLNANSWPPTPLLTLDKLYTCRLASPPKPSSPQGGYVEAPTWQHIFSPLSFLIAHLPLPLSLTPVSTTHSKPSTTSHHSNTLSPPISIPGHRSLTCSESKHLNRASKMPLFRATASSTQSASHTY
jgi:hypothetical protein